MAAAGDLVMGGKRNVIGSLARFDDSRASAGACGSSAARSRAAASLTRPSACASVKLGELELAQVATKGASKYCYIIFPTPLSVVAL